MGSENADVLLLLSGGLDSAALLSFFINNKKKVEAVFVNYGQAAAKEELRSSKEISNHYKIKLSVINLESEKKFLEGEIPYRNAFLIFSSLMQTGFSEGIISMGIHGGSLYPDSNEGFQHSINEVLKCYKGGELVFLSPFLGWSKENIVEYCKKNDVPIKKTYSCERGDVPPCGKCISCKERNNVL